MEQEIEERLTRIEQWLETLVQRQTVKEWYTTTEVARILGKAKWTIREHCRLGRVNAQKRASGRGSDGEWMISHEELERLKNEGLLPVPGYRHPR